CERHHFENVHLPMAMAAGWPLHPNYEGLFRRILQLKQPLRLLCDDITQSTFFLAARKHYKGKISFSRFNTIRFDESTCSARYGEHGYQIFYNTLHFLFPDNFDLNQFYPLTYEMIVREVLIPEAAVRIIQADLDITPEAAAAVIQDSHTFGTIFHP
ncbi:hypothetical protein B0H12DRAFT_980108, partial [Mycena haematopus]